MEDRRSRMSALPVFFDVGRQKSLGYEQLAVGATPLSVEAPTKTITAQIKVEGGRVRYRDDGISPTSSVGMPLEEGETLMYDVSMRSLEFVAIEGEPKLNVLFYGG